MNIAEGTSSYMDAVISEWLNWGPGDERGSEDVATLEALREALRRANFGKVAGTLTLESRPNPDKQRTAPKLAAPGIKSSSKRAAPKSQQAPNPKIRKSGPAPAKKAKTRKSVINKIAESKLMLYGQCISYTIVRSPISATRSSASSRRCSCSG